MIQHLVEDELHAEVVEPCDDLREVALGEALLADLEKHLILILEQALDLLRPHAEAALEGEQQELSSVDRIEDVLGEFDDIRILLLGLGGKILLALYVIQVVLLDFFDSETELIILVGER